MIEELKQRILAKATKISNSTGLIDCSKGIESKFTTISTDKQGVLMETYQMLKKVVHFRVKYGV